MSECPTANEFGVRNNPVCVESVNTSSFDDITSVSDIKVSSLFLSLSLSLSHTHTYSLSLIILHLIIIFIILQDLLVHIREERCAPYYITSTAGKLRGATD